MEKSKQSKMPFFARFLEPQQLTEVVAGQTLAYPSDTYRPEPEPPPPKPK